jgi:DNA-binding NarL/FixJ family response regulator
LTDVFKGVKVYAICKHDNNFQRKNTITMTNKSILALVVSSPGSLQNGLLALMTTIPQISSVLVAEEVDAALRMVENHQPALIIMDMSFPKVQEIIKQIKVQYAHIHLIVLAEDAAQQKEIESFGVDSVLLKGFSAQKLIAIVENVLDQRGGTPPVQANTEGGTNAN